MAAAAGGSSATGDDRCSDLDLTFAVADGVPIESMLTDWTQALAAEAGAATLFDLMVGVTVCRVFLLPDLLQVDLSFPSAAGFDSRSPRFALLCGEASAPPWPMPPPPAHLLDLALHHAGIPIRPFKVTCDNCPRTMTDADETRTSTERYFQCQRDCLLPRSGHAGVGHVNLVV